MKDGIDSGVTNLKNIATAQKTPTRENKIFKDQELLPGFKIDVVLWPEQKDHYMAYLPTVDKLYIFGKTYDEIEKGNESIVELGGAHEVDHGIYFRLEKDHQFEIGSAVMNLVSQNNRAKEVFKNFSKALYSRKDAGYLETHRYGNSEVILENNPVKPGLKDNRWLEIDVDGSGKKEKLFLGLVITELFAYMEMGSHPELCDKNTLDSILATELILAATEFKKCILADKTTMEIVKKNGNLGQGRNVPDLRKYISF